MFAVSVEGDKQAKPNGGETDTYILYAYSAFIELCTSLSIYSLPLTLSQAFVIVYFFAASIFQVHCNLSTAREEYVCMHV